MATFISPSARAVFERVNASAAVTSEGGLTHLNFQAMSTRCRVSVAAPPGAGLPELVQEIVRWVADFEAKYSRFIPDSLIGRINAAAGRDWVAVDVETETLFGLCQEMWFLTRGAFDPTALPLLKLWNWKATPPVIPDDRAVAAALELVGWRKIQRRPGAIFLPGAGMGLDLGGIGKEYAVDRVLELARARGFPNVLVDFGQDVRVAGQPPGKPAWHIGLEDPKKNGNCWAGVGVTNHAVATSGDYLRRFVAGGRRYGHILDPRNGQPVNNSCLAVTVIAPSCTLAGVLSTSAFVLGAADGIKLIQLCPGADGCMTTETARHQTRNFYAYVAS